jgi:hypothetical protein
MHGSDVDRLVAALAAEPETIAELDRAARRFMKTDRADLFGSFRSGINDEPYDAGVVVIDLAARLVAYESTYSHPAKAGCVEYHDGRCATDVHIHYALSDDWKVGVDIDCWEGVAKDRRAQRAANPPLDARAVLYGRPLLQHIARGCYAAFIAIEEAPREDRQYDCVKQLHADWLMTPREDLGGQTPREVLLAKREFIDGDLHFRNLQWAEQRKCPPLLDVDSSAYRYAGFGTHELVVYYDLVRYLLWACCEQALSLQEKARSEYLTVSEFAGRELPRLEQLREAWLDTPEREYSGRTPKVVIQNERRRRPEIATKEELIHDPDCPCCQMAAEMPELAFWGLDGSSMDDEFAFDIRHRTPEEWEEERRSWDDFHRKYESRRLERERLGVTEPSGDCWDAESVWRRSFVAKDCADMPLLLRLFAIGTLLSELTVDIQDAGGERALIDDLSRDFGNLREVLQSDDLSLAQSLAGPVLDRFCDTLASVAAAHEQLREKCDDLQMRLGRFLDPPSDQPDTGEDWPVGDDPPF